MSWLPLFSFTVASFYSFLALQSPWNDKEVRKVNIFGEDKGIGISIQFYSSRTPCTRSCVFSLLLPGGNDTNGFKDGAYFCHCAYVPRIFRCLGFLWVVPTKAEIILRGLKLRGESRTQQALLVFKEKIGSNHAFFRDNKASI